MASALPEVGSETTPESGWRTIRRVAPYLWPAGEREVKLVLRKTLFKYRLHQDPELFDRAYGYIKEYY